LSHNTKKQKVNFAPLLSNNNSQIKSYGLVNYTKLHEIKRVFKLCVTVALNKQPRSLLAGQQHALSCLVNRLNMMQWCACEICGGKIWNNWQKDWSPHWLNNVYENVRTPIWHSQSKLVVVLGDSHVVRKIFSRGGQWWIFPGVTKWVFSKGGATMVKFNFTKSKTKRKTFF